MCGDTVGDSGLDVGESSLHGTERGNLGGDDGAQGVIGQADWGDGGVAQATEQLGGRLAAAVGVPSAERCHTCLAQPAGRLRGRVVGEEREGDRSGQGPEQAREPG